jgi:hypothetical protein
MATSLDVVYIYEVVALSIWLLDQQSGHVIEIELSAEVRAALQCQWERADRLGYGEDMAARLSHALNEQIERLLDTDLRPPTKQQVAFAKAIAAKLKIPLPPSTLHSRSSIGSFLDAYSHQFKQALRKPNGTGAAT